MQGLNTGSDPIDQSAIPKYPRGDGLVTVMASIERPSEKVRGQVRVRPGGPAMISRGQSCTEAFYNIVEAQWLEKKNIEAEAKIRNKFEFM